MLNLALKGVGHDDLIVLITIFLLLDCVDPPAGFAMRLNNLDDSLVLSQQNKAGCKGSLLIGCPYKTRMKAVIPRFHHEARWEGKQIMALTQECTRSGYVTIGDALDDAVPFYLGRCSSK
jgi:hypothetical protein